MSGMKLNFNVSNLNCNGAPEATGTRGISRRKGHLLQSWFNFFVAIVIVLV